MDDDMETIRRREFLAAAAFAPAAAQRWLSKTGEYEKRRLMFAGTQTVDGSSSKGIYAYHWDPATGELKEAGLAAESNNPTFLALDPDAKYLYAANELDHFEGQPGGAVSAFQVDKAAAKLRPINQVASLGGGTCYVTVDHLGRCAFCANYTGGSASSFFLNSNGQISDAVSHFQYSGHGPNKDRQDKPHAHRVTVSPDNRHLLVNDLGLDRIHIYRLDDRSAKLTPNDPPDWQSAPGTGPRALRFHPNGRFAYCVCELASEIYVLHWDAQRGALSTVQQISMIPADYKGQTRGCDIVLNRTGHFAYAANRDYDCLDTYSVDPKDGKLTFMARSSCGGHIPRDLTLDPTERWLLVANQESDRISVFSRDPNSGKLGETGKDYPLAKPQCLVFA